MTEILNQFRDEDLPPSTVDVSGAVLAGRRRRVRARFAAGAVALAVGGATVPLLISARPGPNPPPPAACISPQPTGSSAPTLPTAGTWQRFDPLTSEIDATGVEGYRVTSVTTSMYEQLVTLERTGADREDGAPGFVMIQLFACEGVPYMFDDDQAVPFDPGTGGPAEEIGGAPAYWLPPNKALPRGSISEGLAWQWIHGAWALVVAGPDPGAPTPDPIVLRTTAAQVAPQLRLGAGTPVKSPISMPVPDGMYPLFTQTGVTSDFGQGFPDLFTIGFNTIGRAEPTNPFVSDYVPSLTVGASSLAKLEDRPGNATEYSENLGFPAFQAVHDYGTQEVDALLVYEFFGFGMDLMPVDIPGASTKAERLSRAADVFRTITVYPGAATDASAWGDPIVP